MYKTRPTVSSLKASGAMAWPNAFYTMLAKFPELQGMLRYARRRRAAGSAITYK